MNYHTGDVVCGCRLEEECGRGSYGVVFVGVDTIGVRRAVKLIPCGSSLAKRELTGLRNYKKCHHRNLLAIHHVEQLDDVVCCIMDLADDLRPAGEAGGYLPDTLSNRLRRRGMMPGEEVIAMVEGLLDGLEEMHRQGLVHRDIKPDNILWVNGEPTLADAGTVGEIDQGTFVGTFGFMSPNRANGGTATPADDFYALGKVIYCAWTGRKAVEYPNMSLEMTISGSRSLGVAMRESCERPIGTAEEFRQLLRGSGGTARRWWRRPRVWWGVGAGLLLASGLGLGLWLSASGEPATEPPAAREARLRQERVERTLALLSPEGESGLGEGALAMLLSFEPLSHAGLRTYLAGRRPGSRTAPDVFFIVRRDWPDADAAVLGRSQAAWRTAASEASSSASLLSRMLREDAWMRAAGVELLLLRQMDMLLEQETVSVADERSLTGLCRLRTDCLADAAAAAP